MFLTMLFRNAFEDFFLSDEEGKLLNRLQTNLCDSMVSSFFNQSYTMIRSTFTFNKDLDLNFNTFDLRY